MKKKLLAVLTVLVLVISVFPAPANAAGLLYISIGSTRISDRECWYVNGSVVNTEPEADSYIYYDGEDTLVLHNICLNLDDYTEGHHYPNISIHRAEDLTVVLEGTNVIMTNEYDSSFGISAYCGVEIRDSQSVKVTAADENAGLYVYTFSWALNMMDSNAEIKSGNVVFYSVLTNSYIDRASSLIVSGGKVSFINGSARATDLTITRDSSLTVSGGAVAVGDPDLSAYGSTGIGLAQNSSVSVADGSLTVTEGRGIVERYGEDSRDKTCSVSVTGGKLGIDAMELGISLYNGDIALSGGVLDINVEDGDDPTDEYSINVCGISIENMGGMNVSGGTLKVGLDTSYASVGIYIAEGDLVLNGDETTVDAVMTDHSIFVIGIGVDDGDVIIEGGKNKVLSNEIAVLAGEGDLIVSGGENEICGDVYGFQTYDGSALFTGGTTHFKGGQGGIYTTDGITLDGTVIKEGYFVDAVLINDVASLVPVGTKADWSVFTEELDESMDRGEMYALIATDFTVIPESDNPQTAVSFNTFLYMMIILSFAVLAAASQKAASVRKK